MSDLIDRDALLKEMGLTDAVKYGNKNAEQQDRSYSTWMSYEIADAIQYAPAVNRWIPCSERLPERTGYYLVCDSTAEFDNIRGRQDVSKYVIGRHGGHWYGAISREHITHWMPLPSTEGLT